MANNFSATTRQNLALLIFNKTAWTDLAISDAGTTTNFYIMLSTELLDADSTAVTNEVPVGTYTGYARKAILRTTGGWTCTAGVVTNTAVVTFDTISAGSPDLVKAAGITHAASGAGALVAWGPLTTELTIGTGVTPTIQIGGVSLTIL